MIFPSLVLTFLAIATLIRKAHSLPNQAFGWPSIPNLPIVGGGDDGDPGPETGDSGPEGCDLNYAPTFETTPLQQYYALPGVDSDEHTGSFVETHGTKKLDPEDPDDLFILSQPYTPNPRTGQAMCTLGTCAARWKFWHHGSKRIPDGFRCCQSGMGHHYYCRKYTFKKAD